MKKIKILYLINDLEIGGAERMLEKLSERIDKNKFDLAICSLIKGGEIANQIKNGTKLYEIGAKRLIDFPKAVIKVRKIIKKEKPDVLHCFMYHSNIIGRFAAIGTKCKVICSIRGKLFGKKIESFLDKNSQFLVDKYTVNSNSLKKYALKYGIKKNKINLIENGLEISKLKPSKSKNQIKKELKIKNIPVITSIANLRKLKDYPTMLKSISLVQKKIEVSFLIVGKGSKYDDETKKIKQIIRDYKIKNVNLLGHRTDIPNILYVTDIWISATLSEGQSNSLLEAMAMKKAIVTTNIPENSEVARDKKEALLVPTKSPKKMATSILKLLNNKRLAEKLGRNARKRIEERFDIKESVNKIEKMYKKILRK